VIINRMTGGASQSYTVTKYTAYENIPASGNDLDIAVITPDAILSHWFDYIAPVVRPDGSALQAGDLYFKCDVTAEKSVYLNGLHISPYAAYQYSGAAWVAVEAYIYYLAHWSQIGQIVLYDAGNDYYSEFVLTPNEGSGVSVALGASQIDIVKVAGDGNKACRVARPTRAFDLTGISSIQLIGNVTALSSTTYAAVYGAVGDVANFVYDSTKLAYVSRKAVGVFDMSIDTSAITGTHYIYIGLWSWSSHTSTAYVSKVVAHRG